MNEILSILLRVAGVGQILLALLHIPVSQQLGWREDTRKLTPANASIFWVHTLFICLVLVLMGLPCLLAPNHFLERSQSGAWTCWSFAAFWSFRWFCQFFVYQKTLWAGKRRETIMHVIFSIAWTLLAGLFLLLGFHQMNGLW